MGDIERRLNKAGIKRGVIWDLEVDVNAAGNQITPLNPGAPAPNVQMIEDPSYGPFENDLTVGNFNPLDFAKDFEWRYDGLEAVLLAALMGTAPAPAQYFKFTTSNNKIDFDEGGAELTATVAVGTYPGAAAATAIAAAMNAAVGIALTYTCTFSSTTGKFTIGAGGAFAIHWNTGTNKLIDISEVCGYSDVADDTGAASYVADTVGVGGALNYLHTLTLAEKAAGIFYCYAVEMGSKIHVIPSFKIAKGTFSLDNGLIKASFGLRGSRVIDDSAIITAMAALTIPTNKHLRALYSQAVWRMNNQTGDALAAGDEIRPKSFSFDALERKFDGEHGSASRVIIEPRENGKPSVKLTLEFSRMDTTNAAYFAAWTAGTEKKLDLTITGPVIEGAYSYFIKFELPRLIIEKVEYADSEIIPAKVELRASVADAAPTGMTGLTNPINISIMNTRATSLLA